MNDPNLESVPAAENDDMERTTEAATTTERLQGNSCNEELSHVQNQPEENELENDDEALLRAASLNHSLTMMPSSPECISTESPMSHSTPPPPNSESVCNNSSSFREGDPLSPFRFIHPSKYDDDTHSLTMGRLRYDDVGEEEDNSVHTSPADNIRSTPVPRLMFHHRLHQALDDSVVISTPISSTLLTGEQNKNYDTPLTLTSTTNSEGSLVQHQFYRVQETDEFTNTESRSPLPSFFSTLNISPSMTTSPNSFATISTLPSTPSIAHPLNRGGSFRLGTDSTSPQSALTRSSSTSKLLQQSSPYRFLKSSLSSSNLMLSAPLRLSEIPNQLIEDKLKELRKQLQGHPMISSPRYYTIPSYRSVYSHSHTEAGVDTDRMLQGFVRSCRKDIYQNGILRDEFKKHIQNVCDSDGRVRKNAIENIKILDRSFSTSSLLTSQEHAKLHPHRVESLPSFDHIQPRVSHLPKQPPTPEPVEKLFPPFRSKCALTQRVNSRFMEWCEQKKENSVSCSPLKSSPKTLQGRKTRKGADRESNDASLSSSPSLVVTKEKTNEPCLEASPLSTKRQDSIQQNGQLKSPRTPNTSLNKSQTALSSGDKKVAQNEALPLRISALYNLAMNINSPSRREQIEKEKQDFLDKCISFQKRK